MKFKNKIVISSLISIFIFCLILLYLKASFLDLTYQKIEKQEALSRFDMLERALNLDLNRALIDIKKLASSKSAEVITSKNITKTEHDLAKEIVDSSPFDVIYYYSIDGKVLAKLLNSGMQSSNRKMQVVDYLSENNISLLFFDQKKKSSVGFISTPEENVLVAYALSNPSNNSKGGYVVAYKLLDDSFLDSLLKGTYSTSKLYSLKSSISQIPSSINVDRVMSSGDTVFQHAINDKKYSCYTTVKDIYGNETFLIYYEQPRTHYIEACSILNSIIYIVMIVGVIIIFLTTNGIQYLVVKPIKLLTDDVYQMISTKVLTRKTDFSKRKDEVGLLSSSFDTLISMLHEELKNTSFTLKSKLNDLKNTEEDVLFKLATAIENRDKGTNDNHVLKVRKTMTLFAQKLKFPQPKAEIYGLASTLHNIGKIGLPDYVLGKDGKYSVEEYDAMKSHTTIGGKVFEGGKTELVNVARDMALYHHEAWDGSGYVTGASGKDIPLSARMMTIVDVFIGMTSSKSYRKRHSTEEVIKYMEDKKGKIFDPILLETFLEHIEEFVEISRGNKIGFGK